jgi:hypothetical protein
VVLLTLDGLHVPLMLLVEAAGNTGTEPPAQMLKEVPKENVGVIFGFTVTTKLVVVAHWPAPGVNVYVPEVVLLTVDGLQVPVMLLLEVPGNAGTVPPEQIVSDVPKLNAGVTFGFTVTLNVAFTAHWPAVGVNVYVAELVLLTVEGLHVPVTPFVDVAGNDGTVPPEQIVSDVPKENAGVRTGFTVTVNVVFVAHWPAVGVKV